MKIKKLTYGIALFCATVGVAMAAPHTWHNINVENGAWTAKLQMLNEKGSFVTTDGSSVSELLLDPTHAKSYGFDFDPYDDFDVAYTLTLIQQDQANTKFLFNSKVCVYVITAEGPAQPDIRVSSFHGAKCDWKTVPGVGEDFFVA